jgi:tRNA-intron endonuclease
MHATLDADGRTVHLDGDARQRFYDSRGYGRPTGGDDLELAPVEAAHLLQRGDLDSIDVGGRDVGFQGFLATTGVVLEFVVYKDLRDRGFYLSPIQHEDHSTAADGDVDFVVYPRGSGPWDDEVVYRVRVVGEREAIPARELGDIVLAVVDEDGDLTYFETTREAPGGTLDADPPQQGRGMLLADRVLVWDPPEDLYEGHFYGQRLYGRNADSGPLQLSLLEAASLVRQDALAVTDASGEPMADDSAVVARGRAVEGERFDRRLETYTILRAGGGVPKSGFKFGADFRVYESFDSVSDLSHSDSLVRVLPPSHTFFPRDLSLDVRLAGGVRKRMVFALTDANGGVDWLSVARLTP